MTHLIKILLPFMVFLHAQVQNLKEEKLPEWIHYKPINYDEKRIALMKEYALMHYGTDNLEIVPRMIVIHWTGGKSLKSALSNFSKTELSGREYLKKFGKVNVSSHYLVDRNGDIYKLMPDTLMGRHVIGLNHCSIGIENVGNNNLTDKQLKANAKLVEYLAKRYETIEYLIGHYEYIKFENHPLFIEKIKGYRTKKSDPGKKFMEKLRIILSQKNISLKSEP